MKPLCEKIYFDKIVEIVVWVGTAQRERVLIVRRINCFRLLFAANNNFSYSYCIFGQMGV